MRERIAFYRRVPIPPHENPNIGCIMLAEPFFWPKESWIPCPDDFKLNTVQGKSYESESGVGRELWSAVSERIQHQKPTSFALGTAALAAVESNGYGKPQIVFPRGWVRDYFEFLSPMRINGAARSLASERFQPWKLPILSPTRLCGGMKFRTDS